MGAEARIAPIQTHNNQPESFDPPTSSIPADQGSIDENLPYNACTSDCDSVNAIVVSLFAYMKAVLSCMMPCSSPSTHVELFVYSMWFAPFGYFRAFGRDLGKQLSDHWGCPRFIVGCIARAVSLLVVLVWPVMSLLLATRIKPYRITNWATL